MRTTLRSTVVFSLLSIVAVLSLATIAVADPIPIRVTSGFMSFNSDQDNFAFLG